MKKISLALVFLLFFTSFLFARIHHIMWTEEVFEPTNKEDFKIYKTATPNKEYEEIGEFWGNITPLINEACARGADAFIITGALSYTAAEAVFTGGVAVKESNAKRMIAIKFLPYDNSVARADWSYLTETMTKRDKDKFRIQLYNNALKHPGKKSLLELATLDAKPYTVQRAKERLNMVKQAKENLLEIHKVKEEENYSYLDDITEENK